MCDSTTPSYAFIKKIFAKKHEISKRSQSRIKAETKQQFLQHFKFLISRTSVTKVGRLHTWQGGVVNLKSNIINHRDGISFLAILDLRRVGENQLTKLIAIDNLKRILTFFHFANNFYKTFEITKSGKLYHTLMFIWLILQLSTLSVSHSGVRDI